MEDSKDMENSPMVSPQQTDQNISKINCKSPEKESAVEKDIQLDKPVYLHQALAGEGLSVTGAVSTNDEEMNNPTSPSNESKVGSEKCGEKEHDEYQNFLEDVSGENVIDSNPIDTGVIDLTVESSNQDETKSKGFICACGHWFEKSVELAAHSRWSCKLKRHHVTCDICSMGFVAERGLRRHMNTVHGGMVPCGSCDMRFPNKIKLTKHWSRDHHKEGESLPCFVCGNVSFTERYELECHLLKHKYEKRFGDGDYCEKSEHLPFHPPPMFTRAGPPFIPSPYKCTGPRFYHGAHWPFPRLPPSHPWTRAAPFPGHMFPPPPPPPPPLPPFPVFPMPPHNIVSENQDASSDNPSQEQNYKVDPSVSMESSPKKPDKPKTRHDRVYPDSPNFSHIHPPHLHKHFPHKCGRGKMKWKKYMKHLAMDQVSRQFSQSMNFSTNDSPSTNEIVGLQQNEPASTSYKMACKFCNKPLDKGSISWHHRKECPALTQHWCYMCDKVFRKRHYLIKHMHEENHFLLPPSMADESESFSLNLTGDAIASDVLSLPNKMASVLNLTIPDTGPGDAEKQSSIAESAPQTTKSTLESSYSINMRPKQFLQCNVCKTIPVAAQNLVLHLQEHIHQVTAIQKVREWRHKSVDYFLNKDTEECASGNDNSSVPGGLDSELSSIATTATEESSTKLSGLDMNVNKVGSAWTEHRGRRRGRKHKGEIFFCDFCDEHFSYLKHLKGHMKSVHKECSLECPVCKKKFKWSQREHFYERHVNSHYGVNVFNHKCQVCGKTFLEKCKLRAHMSLHNDIPLYQCRVCDKGYGNKSSLVRHERKHTGERPHKCESCDQSFAEKRDLLRHSAKHTGVAPFSCPDCGRGFTLKTSLMTHMKRQHSGETKPFE